jgi:CHAT domain-containing protein
VGTGGAIRLWREAADLSSSISDTCGVARALGNVGAGFYAAGALDSASYYLDQAYDLAVQSGDFLTAANATTNLANVSQDRGELARAASLYRRSLSMRERSGDHRGLASDEHNLGLVSLALGDHEGARRQFETAREINRRSGDLTEEANNLIGLSDLAVTLGDYERARTLIATASAKYRDAGDRSGSAVAFHRAGLLALRRGLYPEANAALSRAVALFEAMGRFADAAEARLDASASLSAMGHLDAAVLELDLAETSLRADAANPRLSGDLALAKADVALLLNDYEEAEQLFGRAQTLYTQAHHERGRAEALLGATYLLMARQRHAEAASRLRTALAAGSFGTDQRAVARVQLAIGYANGEAGDREAARIALGRSVEMFRTLGDVVGEAVAISALGDMEMAAGFPSNAEALYRDGLTRLADRVAPEALWRLHGGLGVVLKRLGELDAARQQLRAAVELIEGAAASTVVPFRRSAFLADKWEVYALLARAQHEAGRPDLAFETSERMRARRLAELLGHGRFGLGSEYGSFARAQDLNRYIEHLVGLQNPTARRSASMRDPAAAPAEFLADRLRATRAERAELLEELSSEEPGMVTLVAPPVTTWRETATRLDSGTALLEYLISDSTTLALVVTSDTIATVDLGVSRTTLRALVDFSRSALTPDGSMAKRKLWRAPLARLHSHLIAPLEVRGLLEGKRHLRIVPHGELHYLPFQALVSSGAPTELLIERYDVSYLPSASVWMLLGGEKGPAQPSRVLALAPSYEQVPATRMEVEEVARAFGSTATVLLGRRASETEFSTRALHQDIVHLATRGFVNVTNPFFSYTELSPDAASDGRLEVHEVFDLKLRARLVVLSACETAVGSGLLADVPAGDDWVGLVGAFLFAGASNVVASLWRVEDRATAVLMSHFYRELREGYLPPAALSRAQRAMLADPDFGEPFYWAGFTMSGSS